MLKESDGVWSERETFIFLLLKQPISKYNFF